MRSFLASNRGPTTVTNDPFGASGAVRVRGVEHRDTCIEPGAHNTHRFVTVPPASPDQWLRTCRRRPANRPGAGTNGRHCCSVGCQVSLSCVHCIPFSAHRKIAPASQRLGFIAAKSAASVRAAQEAPSRILENGRTRSCEMYPTRSASKPTGPVSRIEPNAPLWWPDASTVVEINGEGCQNKSLRSRPSATGGLATTSFG